MYTTDYMGILAWLEADVLEGRQWKKIYVPLSPVPIQSIRGAEGPDSRQYGYFEEGPVLIMPSNECGVGRVRYYGAIPNQYRSSDVKLNGLFYFLAYKAVETPSLYYGKGSGKSPNEQDVFEVSGGFCYCGISRIGNCLVVQGVFPWYAEGATRVINDKERTEKTFAKGETKIDVTAYLRGRWLPRLSYMNREKLAQGHWDGLSPHVGITYTAYPLVEPANWSKSKLWRVMDYVQQGAIDSLSDEEKELAGYVWWFTQGALVKPLDYVVWCRCYEARKRHKDEAAPLWLRGSRYSKWYMRFKGSEQRGPSKELKDLLIDEQNVWELEKSNIPFFYMGDAMPDDKEAAESILGRNEAYEAAMKGEWYGGFGACLYGIHPSGAGAIDDVKRMTRKEIAEFVPSIDMGSVSLGRKHSLAYAYTRHGWRTYVGWPALRLYLSMLGDPSPYGEPLEWAYSACPFQVETSPVSHGLAPTHFAKDAPTIVDADQLIPELVKEFDSNDVMHGLVPDGLDPHEQKVLHDPQKPKIWWVRPADTTPPQNFPTVYTVELFGGNVEVHVDGEQVKGH
jgi:hypothetical protein